MTRSTFSPTPEFGSNFAKTLLIKMAWAGLILSLSACGGSDQSNEDPSSTTNRSSANLSAAQSSNHVNSLSQSSVLYSSEPSSASSNSNSAAVSSAAPPNISAMDLTHLWGGAITSERKNALDDAVIHSTKQPYTGHPRLYGSNSELTQRMRAFEELDPNCSMGGTVSGVGTVKQMQGQWDLNTKGGFVVCQLPPTQ